MLKVEIKRVFKLFLILLLTTISFATTTATAKVHHKNSIKKGSHKKINKNVKVDTKNSKKQKKLIVKDYILTKPELISLKSLDKKIGVVFRHIGYKKSNIINYYDFIKELNASKGLTPLTKNEKEIFDKIYYMDAKEFGFKGARVSSSYKKFIKKEDLIDVGSGHYLYRGKSYRLYEQISRDTNDTIMITSGFRNVLKQFYIFTMRVIKLKGDMTKAKDLIAPPAYSYHYHGDFDIGVVGMGIDNFTSKIIEYKEYQKLIDLGTISIRYTKYNKIGVKYEPWHIKIN